MQLKKIKLAGFKSFVDPTVVPLSGRLVAVVGPNGCGKSNIIDAISWVMGESSAKYLRGESLTDVIFNGSNTRKPIGQASVELIFDNQDGSLQGEYASYGEISIRRLITRNGDSSYFLNGTRCRRRDIIDIFLGTGLGPRSYSIIGQNMISRLIEAKPDEMRIYLEEAAGVSKYKERRRETENRIQHTKENLARLSDIRAELEKQLSSLKRQANTAEKFKLLKQEERLLRSQWYAIQWRDIDVQLIQYTLQIQQQQTALEARQTEFSEIDFTLETKREEQHAANEVFQEVQKRYYSAGNEITRIEQDIHYHSERQQQWINDLSHINDDWQTSNQQIEEIEEELHDLACEIVDLEPTSKDALQAVSLAMEELAASEEAVHNWQVKWDQFNQQIAKITQAAEVEQTRIQHVEQRLISITQRQSNLKQDQEKLNCVELEKEINRISILAEEASATTEERDYQLHNTREEIDILRTRQQKTAQELDQVRSTLQRLRGKQASLEALQQTALGQRDTNLINWLSQHNLDKQPRLAQALEVQSGWEHAVEKVLGTYLQAICVDNVVTIASKIDTLQEGSLSAFALSANEANTNHTTLPNATTMLSKIKSNKSLESLLGGIYVVDSLGEALTLCKALRPTESVITRDGIWLSSSWLRLSREENPAAGVFQREQELKQLAQQIDDQVVTQNTLEEDMQIARETLTSLEQQRDQLQQLVNQAHAKSAEIQTQQKMQQERLNELKNRAERISKDQAECTHQLQLAEVELTTARNQWQQAMSQLEQEANQREVLLNERDQSREKLQAIRSKVNQTKDSASQIQIRLQTAQSQQSTLKQTIGRMQSQLTILTQRKTLLEQELGNAVSLNDFENNLSSALSQRLAIEEELNSSREAVEGIEQDIRTLESKRQALERDMNKLRDTLETLRLEGQSLKIKSENLREHAEETGFIFEEILKALPEEAKAHELQAQFESVTHRIDRLGPINLIAIEEYATCSERKEYLDKQNDDLQSGLDTLEDAIAKIDKETRAKFKDTFDYVNERFQTLFPTIFGGGKAHLELTGDNLLDAGVTVMACPPGKRNSTIHLLSGGEKAMTAIALVFSIFHLNPAPFCLLDEVDAPLDDANIGRFCQLVKSMSDKTQFIFISHNKLAIEMAEHLMGVTMHEPGVSRLVSVDIQEAINLVEA